MVFCGGTPTYTLSGHLGADDCLFEDVMPADLGGGEFGFTISADGSVSGVQVSDPDGGTPVPRRGLQSPILRSPTATRDFSKR